MIYSVHILRVAVVCLCLLAAERTMAQTPGLSIGKESEALLEQSLKSSASSLASDQARTGFPVDNVVSAEHYYLGPGDVLLLQRIDAISSPGEPLVVTPENTLILPRYGELDLRNKTLAQVRQEIRDSVARRLPGVRVFVSLQRPRTVYVTIKGGVQKPGLYAFPASMTVSTAVRIADGKLVNTTQEQLVQGSKLPTPEQIEAAAMSSIDNQYVGGYSERNIQVLHRDGSTDIADGIRAQVMGDPSSDKLLREGDDIYVPRAGQQASLISISGAVRRSVVVPFRSGDRTSFLLRLSYGLADNADSSRVLLIDRSGGRTPIDVAAAMNGTNDRELMPGSSIIVEEKVQTADAQSTVAITGQVQSPGTYVISLGTTRLRDIIGQAGGFTSRASLPLSYVLRNDQADGQNQRTLDYYLNIQKTSLTILDTMRYKLDMQMRRPVVSTDFVAAFERNSEVDNVVLQNGDVIVVPETPKNVFVFGQVIKPGYIAFEPGKTMDWYIARAGGYASDADEERTRIVKARTKLWIEGEDYVFVEAGDEIYVPRPMELPPGLTEQRYSTIAAFGGILVGLAGIIANIFIFSK